MDFLFFFMDELPSYRESAVILIESALVLWSMNDGFAMSVILALSKAVHVVLGHQKCRDIEKHLKGCPGRSPL